uniref:Uncharacterized protein n=1 Tax=Sphaerodactylus townsendi TaxID=933632 RepID=A0ACB8EFL8_9SAUR
MVMPCDEIVVSDNRGVSAGLWTWAFCAGKLAIKQTTDGIPALPGKDRSLRMFIQFHQAREF